MQAEVLVSTKELNREQWLDWRRKGIGGSDAAAVAGLNPWKSPVEVWLEKTGQVTEQEDNEKMYWGRILEDIVAEEFAKRTGKKIWRVNQMLQHPKYSFMLANLDRRVVREDALLECKTTSAWNKDEWAEGVPELYQIQAQHYLAVTGYKKAYVAVLIGGSKFKHFEIQRDDEIIEALIKIEADFWKLVEQEIPPEPDGSQASTELLNKMYPKAEPGKIIDLDNSIEELIEKHKEYKEIEGKYKELRTEIENKIKNILGDAEIGRLNGEEVVKWKNISSTRLNTKKLKKEHPDIYEQYVYESSYRRLYL